MRLVGTVTEFNYDNDPFVTNGKEYEVIEESKNTYEIIDDSGRHNTLSKDKENDEAYYGNWFKKEEDNGIEELRKQHLELVQQLERELDCVYNENSKLKELLKIYL